MSEGHRLNFIVRALTPALFSASPQFVSVYLAHAMLGALGRRMDRDELIALLRLRSCPGEQTASSGAIRFGHVPTVAPLAYLHSLYAPLNATDIEALQKQIPVAIPAPYMQFLQVSNGLHLFVSAIALFGFRGTSARDLTARDWPFSIVTPNCMERPRDLEEGAIVIGTYCEDGSSVVMIDSSETVVCVTPDGGEVRATWPSLGHFLREEIPRIDALVAPTYEGLRFDSHVRTLPGKPLVSDSTPRQKADKSWWRFW